MSKTLFNVRPVKNHLVAQQNVEFEGKPSRFLGGNIQTIATILAKTFVDDPMFEFIFPDPTTRLEALIAFFQPFVVDGINRGEVLLAPANQGVCIWYPADVSLFSDEFEVIVEEVIAIASSLGGSGAGPRFEHLANQVGAYEPTDLRCEVLWIGLLPEARGRGLGGHLLQPALNAADAQGVGSYLVSSNARNLSFYQRHGFRKTDSIEISPTYSMTGMWRSWNRGSQV